MTPIVSVDRRRPRGALLLVGLLAAACGFIAETAPAKLETWREETASAFTKAHREGVVVSSGGRVRLGQRLSPLGTLDAAHVWDLARTDGGDLYAATGDAGQVFRHAGKDGEGAWTAIYAAKDTQALALAVLADGHVVVGTGPSGQVIDLTDPEHPASTPDRAVQYIWDLAADRKGNLYAATGPSGQLWKRSDDGKWSLLLDSRHTHLLCVAVGPDGSVYAGSDGEGLIYRVAADGKTSVVYDAPQSEVRTLRFGPDGALYAGTAAESGGGGSGRGASLFSGGDRGDPGASPAIAPGTGGTRAADVPRKPESPPSRAATNAIPSGGSALPRAVSSGDNSVYRIGADGVPREVFRVKAMIYALAWQGDRLLVGTGPEGQLYEVRDLGLGQESAPIARLDNGQILAMLEEPGGRLILGNGDPGAVVRLLPGHVERGTLISDVHDTKLISRFGALSWRAEQPEGTAFSLQVRTGNVAEPDATWSAWSSEQTDPRASRADVPPGRFVQYRATLATRNPDASPELNSVALSYQSANLPPEINKLDVPDLAAGDGATRQTRLTLRWDVTDPNGDDLSYTLHVRKEGWPEWVPLGSDPLTETNYAWDTTAVPAGLYRVRVTASDRPSNNPDDALTRERASETFIVDHEVPGVSIAPKDRGAVVTLRDNLTRLVKAAYALDSGEWVAIFPDDGLFDTPGETITIRLPDLKPGAHVLMVRASDAAGNVGTGDALIEAR